MKKEKKTRYFLNLENRAACKKKVTKLLLEDSTETNDPDVILKKQEEFFSHLYKSQGPSVENSNCGIFFHSTNMTTLSEEMSNSCDGKIASDECLLTLKEFENGKSPNSDGFTAELYKFFWKELSENLTSSLNHAFEKGELSICQRRGIISLLPKKSKPTNSLKNLRPISLLNTDYKIATKVLARRLENVLPFIINPDQTGSI